MLFEIMTLLLSHMNDIILRNAHKLLWVFTFLITVGLRKRRKILLHIHKIQLKEFYFIIFFLTQTKL